MLEITTRPLNAKEQRALRRRTAIVLAHVRRQRRRMVSITVFMFGTVWLTLLIYAEAPWYFTTLFCAAVILPVCGWFFYDDARKARARLGNLAAALEGGHVREVRIVSEAFVDFEEEEDEGAQYAFDLLDGTLVFVTGQDFYSTRTFPNSDFSIAYVHASSGELVDLYIVSHGRPLTPTRTISADAKRHFRIPEHLERVRGSLADIERVLAA